MNREIKIKLLPAIEDFVTLGLYFWTCPIEFRNKFDSFVESFRLFLEKNYPTLKLWDGDLSIGYGDWITIYAQEYFEYNNISGIDYLEYNGYEVEFNEDGDKFYTWEENAYTEYGQEPHEQCAEIVEDAFRDKFNKQDRPFPSIEKYWQGEHASSLQQKMKNEDGYGPRVERNFFSALCDYVANDLIEEREVNS